MVRRPHETYQKVDSSKKLINLKHGESRSRPLMSIRTLMADIVIIINVVCSDDGNSFTKAFNLQYRKSFYKNLVKLTKSHEKFAAYSFI